MMYDKENYEIIKETGLAEFEDDNGNLLNIDEMIAQAEKDLGDRQTANLNLRWNKSKIERLKLIANARNQKYQTFVKSVLEQVLEAEEKRLGLSP